MAELNSTVVHGKLSTTGKIYQMGQAIDNRYASGVALDDRVLYLVNSDGNYMGNGLRIPYGSISFSTQDISNNLSIRNNTNNYTMSGSASFNGSCIPGYIDDDPYVQVTVSKNINKSSIYYYTGNSSSQQSTKGDTVNNVDPGTTVTISEGYYHTTRTIYIAPADVSGEAVSGTLNLTGSITDGSSILSSSGNTTDYYKITFTPTANIPTAGWISGVNNTTSYDRYIKKGSATTPTNSTALSSSSTSLSGTTLTVQAKVTPTVVAGYVASGTEGTVKISGTVPTETKTASAAGDVTPGSGKLLSKVTVPSATVGSVNGGGVSGGTPSVNKTNFTTTTSSTNSGIAVSATRTAITRAATGFSETFSAGWIASQPTGLSQSTGSSATSTTEYIESLTVGNGKTLSSVVLGDSNGAGTLTTLTMANNGTIGTLTASGSATRTLTISSIDTNNLNLTVSSNSGKIHITNVATGMVYFTGPGKSEQTLTNQTTGQLITATLPTLSASSSPNLDSSTLHVNDNMTTSLGLTADQPSSGYYITLSVDNKTYGSYNIQNSSAISAGWLEAISKNSNLGTFSLTLKGLTRYIVVPSSTKNSGSSSNTLSVNSSGTNISYLSSGTSDYYIKMDGSASIKPTAGWTPGTALTQTGNKTVYITKGGVTMSSTPTNASVSLTQTVASADATNYGITTSNPSGSYVTLTSTTSGTSGSVTTTTSTTNGYITSSDVEASESATVAVGGTGSKHFYIPKVTPAFTGGGVSSSISGWNSSNATLTDTNTGISVTATPKSSRTAVTWNGERKGLISISSGTEASAAVGNTNGTAASKYISGVTVPSGKSFSVNNVGTTNVTSNTGTLKYETNWSITKDGSNNLTFTYSA